MKTFEFEGYELYSTDGYSHKHLAYFTNRVDAERAEGNDFHLGVSPKKLTVVAYDSFEEYEQSRLDEECKTALAKLTPRERVILGLE